MVTGRPGRISRAAADIIASGNEVGLSLADWQALDAAAQDRHRQRAQGVLRAAGAHYTIDTIADIVPVTDAINACLQAGGKAIAST